MLVNRLCSISTFCAARSLWYVVTRRTGRTGDGSDGRVPGEPMLGTQTTLAAASGAGVEVKIDPRLSVKAKRCVHLLGESSSAQT